jgi:DNA-binding PadR family transcriptional regulator
MARGRESQYVKQLTHRDLKLFTQLAKTGLTDRNQATLFCNLNLDRLKKLENSGYINRRVHAVDGKPQEIIRLDKKGKKFCKRELGVKSFATAQTNHLTHDLKVSAAYYSLPEYIQKTWEHEREILQDIYSKVPGSKGKMVTCIDARININGFKVAIEVVGSSYSQALIDLKQDIALNLAGCHSIEFVR